jgi:hypothetical protein
VRSTLSSTRDPFTTHLTCSGLPLSETGSETPAASGDEGEITGTNTDEGDSETDDTIDDDNGSPLVDTNDGNA